MRPFPKPLQSTGCIYVTPFTDEVLYNEVVGKAQFWNQASYRGVNLQALWQPAVTSYLSQVPVRKKGEAKDREGLHRRQLVTLFQQQVNKGRGTNSSVRTCLVPNTLFVQSQQEESVKFPPRRWW